MANVFGTPLADILNATGPGDRLFGFSGNDRLNSRFADTLMNSGSGNDILKHTLNVSDAVSFSDPSIYLAGSGDDRVVIRANIDFDEAISFDVDPSINVDQTILTSTGNDFVFVDNRLSPDFVFPGSGIDVISAKTTVFDQSGDNVVTIKNAMFTGQGGSDAETDVRLGTGDDLVRYVGNTLNFESFGKSTHSFELGDGDNRLNFSDSTNDLDFNLTSGSGRDVIQIVYDLNDPATIGIDGRFDISTGGGNDYVRLDVDSDGNPFQQVVSNIDLGEGNNHLILSQNVEGPITATAGGGNDRLDLTIRQTDSFVDTSLVNAIDIDLGDGQNRANVDINWFGGLGVTEFSLATGDGRDLVVFDAEINETGFGTLGGDAFAADIETGANNDRITVQFADLTLTTGTGSDTVFFEQQAISEDTGTNDDHNRLVLTDIDFAEGDRFVFVDLDASGPVTIRSVSDLQDLAASNAAVSVTNAIGDLVIEVDGAAGAVGEIVFEDLGFVVPVRPEPISPIPIDPLPLPFDPFLVSLNDEFVF